MFYPHNCTGCGMDDLPFNETLCLSCISELPQTDYFKHPGNAVEQIFGGRILIEAGGSAYYFTKESILQHLLHSIKYKGNKEAASFIGKQTGLAIKNSNRFQNIDLILPLPLSQKRLQQRGYNQAALIAQGIASELKIPVVTNAVNRKVNTVTQTGKDRMTRWQTMQDVFAVVKEASLQNKHILLVDDVVTTGASLEACGEKILAVPGTKLSIATVAYTIL